MEIDGLTLEIGMVYKSADPKQKEVWQIGGIVGLSTETQLVSGGFDETKIYKPLERPQITGRRIFFTLGHEIVAATDIEEARKRERIFFVRRDTREENPPWAVVLKKDFKNWLSGKGLSLVTDEQSEPVKDVQAVGIAPLKPKAGKVTA